MLRFERSAGMRAPIRLTRRIQKGGGQPAEEVPTKKKERC